MKIPDDVRVPHRMAHLPRDPRGLPIPIIVMRDNTGKPLFAANDENERQRMFQGDRCHICGWPLPRGRWFVGGHLSACCEHGAFMDGGMHADCAYFALRVCPYLAAPAYGRLVGKTQIAKSDRKAVMLIEDETEHNARPDYFVAIMAVGERYSRASVLPGIELDLQVIRYVRPAPGSVRAAQVWRHGRRVEGDELAAIKDRIAVDVAAVPDQLRPDVWKFL